MPDDAPQLLSRLSNKVGGLDGPLATIVRRALASRLYPPAITKELGISPVRGMLLYGPPGCGKTLLAREITSALGAREPKIVNGPEMMSKVCMHASRQKGTCRTQCKPTAHAQHVCIIISSSSSSHLTH